MAFFSNSLGFASRFSRKGPAFAPNANTFFHRTARHSFPHRPSLCRMVSPSSSSVISVNNTYPSYSSTTSFSTTAEQNVNIDECSLPYETLPYRGAQVKFTQESDISNTDFLNRLRSALDYWKRNDYTSAWIHVHASKSSLVEILTANPTAAEGNDLINEGDGGLGFDLHHVNTTENTIILKKWLRPDNEDKIPPFATHQVGCAGFVLSDDNEILVIREWTGSLSNRTPSKQWKLPGGLLDAGESFAEGTCREVYEETGVTCEFESLLSFWHRHGLTFGKSDFYFVCLLRPKQSKEIDLDPVEVSAAKWMHLEEFMKTQDHPLIHHVLKHAFQINAEDVAAKTKHGRLEPVNFISEDYIQFSNRSPFPTYTGNSTGTFLEG